MKLCKKLTSVLIALALVLTCFAAIPAKVNADTYHSGDFAYQLLDEEATIVAYNGAGGNVTIPSQIDGYPVITIGHDAFYNSNIQKLTIQEGIRTIERGAFESCSSLSSVSLPQSLTYLGGYAFASCDSLTNVTVPGGVKELLEYVFGWCDNLTSVTLSEGITSIGYETFYCCSKLTSINFPGSILSVSSGAFSGCYALNYNTYDNATYLGNPGNPYQILVEGLYYDIPSCQIHPDTKVIAEGAFWGSSYLTSIALPEGLISINNDVFTDCYALTSVSVPSTLRYVGHDVFYGCSSLTYNIYDNGKYLGNTQNPYVLFVTVTDSVVTTCQIHPNTRAINGGAFAYSNLAEIEIPDSVVFVGQYAFNACYNLAKVKLSKSMTEISDWTFYECSSLEAIVIPEGVNTIGNGAFSSCSDMKEVTLPVSVTVVEDFAFNGCDDLENVYYSGTEEQWQQSKIADTHGGVPLRSGTLHCNYQYATGTVPGQTPEDNPVEDSTPSEDDKKPSKKDDDDDDDDDDDYYYDEGLDVITIVLIVAAAIVVIGGGVVAVVLLKKKKSQE